MTDSAALRKWICMNPTAPDNAPRLAYADSIEDENPRLSEFIRLQCELSDLRNSVKYPYVSFTLLNINFYQSPDVAFHPGLLHVEDAPKRKLEREFSLTRRFDESRYCKRGNIIYGYEPNTTIYFHIHHTIGSGETSGIEGIGYIKGVYPPMVGNIHNRVGIEYVVVPTYSEEFAEVRETFRKINELWIKQKEISETLSFPTGLSPRFDRGFAFSLSTTPEKLKEMPPGLIYSKDLEFCPDLCQPIEQINVQEIQIRGEYDSRAAEGRRKWQQAALAKFYPDVKVQWDYAVHERPNEGFRASFWEDYHGRLRDSIITRSEGF